MSRGGQALPLTSWSQLKTALVSTKHSTLHTRESTHTRSTLIRRYFLNKGTSSKHMFYYSSDATSGAQAYMHVHLHTPTHTHTCNTLWTSVSTPVQYWYTYTLTRAKHFERLFLLWFDIAQLYACLEFPWFVIEADVSTVITPQFITT